VHPEIVAEGEHAQIRTPDQDLVAQVILHPGHHAVDDDERAHAHDDSAYGDRADEREEARAAAAPQVAPGDAQLELRHSGRSVGKSITSRMLGVPVRYMKSRSIPIPTPPIGGIPYSIERR